MPQERNRRKIIFNGLEISLDQKVPRWAREALNEGLSREEEETLAPLMKDRGCSVCFAIRVSWNFVWTLEKKGHGSYLKALALLVARGILCDEDGYQCLIDGQMTNLTHPSTGVSLYFNNSVSAHDFAADVFPLRSVKLAKISF